MATTYLTRTPASDGNRKIFTISTWLKRSALGTGQHPIISTDLQDDNDYYSMIYFATDTLAFYSKDGSTTLYFVTDAEFRDVNGWYHIVVAVDTTQATDTNRVKIYVNGEQVTSFSTETYPPQNEDNLYFNRSLEHAIGTRSYDNGSYFSGSMAHFHFIDGTQYDADDFGETDSTTGIWKPKTAPSVTYGTNGFFLKFENSGAFGTDSSGNSNTFTVNGTMTQTIDTPSNVFATLNALSKGIDQTLSNGNTTMVSGTATTRTPSQTTLGMSSGKYYAEFKITDSAEPIPGVAYTQSNYSVSSGVGYYPGYTSSAWGYLGSASAVYNNASSVGGTWSSFTSGDIIGIALDLDNNKLYFSKNGTWQNSGDPESGATGTGAVSITDPSSTTDGYYYFSVGDGSGATTSGIQCNFGNGIFGTTAVSSAQNPDDGIGIFEYDVPAGYRALCTKSINAEEYS